MPRLKTYFLLLPALVFSCSIYTQETYRAIPWDVEQGLSIGGENCMLKDINGFLWIGTNVGLNRFDGNHFTNYFPDKNKSGTIISDYILSLVEDSLHHIWIGTHKGLSRYDVRADTFSNFSSPVQPAIIYPYTIPFWATRDEVFCIEMGSRISAYDIHSFKRRVIVEHFQNDWDQRRMRPVYSILDVRTNSIWMLAKAGLLEVSLKTGRQNEFSFPCLRRVKFLGYRHSSQALCYDPVRHLIWLNTSDGLVEFNLTEKKFLSIEGFNDIVNKSNPNHGSYYPTERIGLDQKGRVWIGTRPNGVFIYDPERKRISQPVIQPNQGNIANELDPVYLGSDGIVWASGRENALYQLNPIRPAVTHYTKDPINPFALNNNWVATIVNGPGGKLWIGTFDGINIFDPGTGLFQVLREKDLPGFKGKNIMPLAMDSSLKKTWLKAWAPDALFEMDITTRKCSIIKVNGDTNTDLGYMEAEKARPYRNGFIFLMQGAGILRVKKDSLTAQLMLPISQSVGRMVLVEDRLLFLKTPNASYNLTYAEKNGVWAQIKNPFDSIGWTNIFFNKNDQTWWVGARREIIHYDKDFHIIRRYMDGFPGIDVLSVLVDNDGNIWIVFRTGNISRLDPKSGKFLTLSERDGIQKQIFGWEHAHVKDAHGDLYFGSGEGLYRISPDKFVKNYPPSTVYLKSIAVNQKPFLLHTGANDLKELVLDNDENNINIETGIIDYYSEGKSRLRYKLDEPGKSWQYGSNQFAISFNELQPGKYRLVMQASNAAGDFNGPEKILMINIHSPFWTTWWFRGIALLILIAFIYGIIRWRLRQKFQQRLKQSEKEKQVAELQQQKTELEMQALRAQMNPHFIFNSLNSINRFILQNNKSQASEYLTKFSKLVRMILQNSQASLITLENELESLELYLELEALRFNYHFDYKISVPKDMDISALKVPPLILQPYVENAIWHGLMHKEEKGLLDIEVIEENDHLYFKITDDGIGREKAAALASKSATKHKSMGLRITAHRIAILQNSEALTSPVTINDLVDANGYAAGTEITIKMPVLYD
jgi:ligand-binding sensor domain-containing protein